MSCVLDSRQIAERLRGLFGNQEAESLYRTAHRLCVSAVALRMSIDETTPEPTMSVLAAVVREFGVDPSWLLFGVYDSMTHHAAIDVGEYATAASMLRLAASQPSDLSMPPRESRPES